jgi:hypothetical protein
VIAAVVLAAAPVAHADDSFESLAQAARPVHHLENVVWALTAACDRGEDTERRQCRLVRDARLAELTATTLLVDADADAFDADAWSPTRKSVALRLSGCIRCAGVEVDGKLWFVTASGTNPRFEDGKLRTDLFYDNGRRFGDQSAAAAWLKSVDTARVQLVVKVPTQSRWTADGKSGLALEVLAYRVVVPCDGSVAIAKPASGPAVADKKQCAPPAAAAPEAPAAGAPDAPAAAETPVAEALTSAIIDDAMHPVIAAAQACYAQHAVTGRAVLRLTVVADGSISRYEQQGDFVGTPTGDCIDHAARAVMFPRSKKAKSSFAFPIALP